MPNGTKKVKSASTVLLQNATLLVNFVTPDANGVVPAGNTSPEAAMATIGYRAGRILSMARKVCNKKAASKGCDRVNARS